MSRVFLDTNILAYQFDGSEPQKRHTVTSLLSDGSHTFILSTQVLLELYQVLTRKLTPPVPPYMARHALERLADLEVVPADAALVLRATRTADANQLSVWDSMILEAAADAGCQELWTEDLDSGSDLRGVRIINPLA